MGAMWRYNTNEVVGLPNTWVTTDYDDDPLTPPYHWAEGASGFANSPALLACSVFGTPMAVGSRTHYFRNRFVLPREYQYSILALRYVVNDGAVFYLNGVEVYRIRMPLGSVVHSTAAFRANQGCVRINLPPEAQVRTGTNVLAVEVHQSDDNSLSLSTDVAFEAELIAYVRTPANPRLYVNYDELSITLTWEVTGWSLEIADEPAGPWDRLSIVGNKYVTAFDSSARKFFRLTSP
jgi:hypothetical protein